jgi:rSAM/selenodomain-associated transferase 1
MTPATPDIALAVICKSPVPGRVKTRLCPPCTPRQAAALATAALADTFAAVRATPAARRVAVLDGSPGPWLGPGIEVLAQRGDRLDERLAHAFSDLGPAVVVGMDTPQVTPRLLAAALQATARHGAALGPAVDGGYWAIGLREPTPELLMGVPMSTAETGRVQLMRLRGHGLRPWLLPRLVDVDDAQTARAVAATAPHGAFAATVASSPIAVEAVA